MVTDEQPDVIGVTETWAKSNIGDEFYQIKGYNCVRSDNNQDIRGGVMIYHNDVMDVSLCKEIEDVKAEDSVWICLRLRLKNFSRPSFCSKRQLQKASS